MSATQMQDYLRKFKRAMEGVKKEEAVASVARDREVGGALQVQQQEQEAYDNFNKNRNEAAEIARNRYSDEQYFSQQLGDSLRAGRTTAANILLQQAFYPFAPNFDPASPNAYTRWAAAASLPGDLPKGDPRNSVVDVVDIGPNGGGTLILKGGGTIPNDGGASGNVVTPPSGGPAGGVGSEAPEDN